MEIHLKESYCEAKQRVEQIIPFHIHVLLAQF